MNDEKRVNTLLRHIRLVQEACQLIGMHMIEEGESEFGRTLIANGFRHDNSKFFGIEWEFLDQDEDKDKLKIGIKQHVTTNKHHPECWGGVENMPRIYVAEMVCDWYARSAEQGTDLWQWIKDKAIERFSIPPQGKKYKEIKYFVDLLLEKRFK